MKRLIPFVTSIVVLLAISSCNKCYDCTLKCGTCTQGSLTVAGCEGDSALGSYSIEAWKAYFESQGFTCTYNNDEESVCGKNNKEAKEDDHYDCLEQ